MKPSCPIPQWEHTFATEYCTQIKSLGKMWRKNKSFGQKTLMQFRTVAFRLCVIVKTVWFPGCPGANYDDCKKFLYIILEDWKDAYDKGLIKGYPMAYLISMVEPEIRTGDLYFESLKIRKNQYFHDPMQHIGSIDFMSFIPISERQKERDKMYQELRFQVLKRDNFRCRYCGRDVNDGIKLHVDHIKPVAKGGKTEMDNLITSCEDCNMGKGAHEFEHLIVSNPPQP